MVSGPQYVGVGTDGVSLESHVEAVHPVAAFGAHTAEENQLPFSGDQ